MLGSDERTGRSGRAACPLVLYGPDRREVAWPYASDLMIVWLNGAFGVGKTAVARELVRAHPHARLSDPERIGFALKHTFWRRVDYQDVELWRRLTRGQVTRAGRRGTAIVPMTIVRRDVFDELTNGARVFRLTASRSTIEHRIAGSGEAQDWRRNNLDRCLEAFENDGLGAPIDTEGLTPTDVANSIMQRL